MLRGFFPENRFAVCCDINGACMRDIRTKNSSIIIVWRTSGDNPPAFVCRNFNRQFSFSSRHICFAQNFSAVRNYLKIANRMPWKCFSNYFNRFTFFGSYFIANIRSVNIKKQQRSGSSKSSTFSNSVNPFFVSEISVSFYINPCAACQTGRMVASIAQRKFKSTVKKPIIIRWRRLVEWIS